MILFYVVSFYVGSEISDLCLSVFPLVTIYLEFNEGGQFQLMKLSHANCAASVIFKCLSYPNRMKPGNFIFDPLITGYFPSSYYLCEDHK